MAPPRDLILLSGLARRWKISKSAAHKVTKREGFPSPADIDDDPILIFDAREVERWEDAERAAGRPLPGEAPRGPAPRRSVRDDDSDEDTTLDR